MSKISRDNKTKSKGPNKSKNTPPIASAESQLPNYGKCCTCRYRTAKLCTSPKSPNPNTYVPRKQPSCSAYKLKD